MDNKKLFEMAMGIKEPWFIKDIQFDQAKRRLDIYLDFKSGAVFPCPVCNIDCKAYDKTEKEWRHLNFFQHEAYLHAYVPRVACGEHKVKQVEVPWARPGSGFTLLLEALIMLMASAMPVATVATILSETDKRLWRVLNHYIEKEIDNINLSDVKKIGVDETASKRGHDYVTLFVDLEKSKVIFVAEGKDAGTIKSFTEFLIAHKGSVENITDVSCDMSPAFISGVGKYLPKARITFDKFHVMKIVNKGVDEVRRQEQKSNAVLEKTRYIWLKNRDNLTTKQETTLVDIEQINLKTVKAYQMKVAFQDIFKQAKTNAEASLQTWYDWVINSTIQPMIDVATTIKNHWTGIVNWFESLINNGILEGLNSLVQAAKAKARGYRTFRNLRLIIFLIAGDLNFGLPT